MAAAERIDNVWTLEGRRGLLRRVGTEEGAARQKANGLRHGGLEETTELRMRAAMSGQGLTEGEEGGQSPANMSAIDECLVVVNILVCEAQIVAGQPPA